MRKENVNNVTESINNGINKYPNVLILGGLPSSGKSTFANALPYRYILSKDTIRYELARRKYTNYNRLELYDVVHEFSVTTKWISAKLIQAYMHLVVKKDSWNVEEILEEMPKKLLPYKSIINDYFIQEKHNLINNDYSRGIVLDSTHLSRKSRAVYMNTEIRQLPIYCVFFDIELSEAIQRNYNRRINNAYYVPKQALIQMCKSVEFPHISEGFTNIYIINDDISIINNVEQVENLQKNFVINNETIEKIGSLFPSFVPCINYNQHNLHHSHLLHQHLCNCAKDFTNEDIALFLMALLHDVGKIDTKIQSIILQQNYSNLKQNKKLAVLSEEDDYYIAENYNNHQQYRIPKSIIINDESWHYYEHEKVSAQQAYRDVLHNGFPQEVALRVYWMIYFHMGINNDDFTINNKVLLKMKQCLSDEDINNVILFKHSDVKK